jgi:hypothetical protein
MDWFEELFKGAAWGREERRKRRDIFVLMAITNAHSAELGYSIKDSSLDLRKIEGLIAEAQLVAAGCSTGDYCYIEPLVVAKERISHKWKLKWVEWRYGLPALNHPQRLKKIATLLHDNPRLRFEPPDMWSVIV